MLTRELAIAECDRGRVIPDRLTAVRHRHYLELAERMLDVYRGGIGHSRRDLHRAIHALFAAETDCPVRRLDAFCKLLDDVSEYAQDRRGAAAALRREVFRRAALRHPLVRSVDRLFESDEQKVKATIASELGRSWADIEEQLFSDVIDFQRLQKFEGYPSGRELLARYNIAQVQVALFDAVSLRVLASDDLKTILRYSKLARLMHTIQRRADGRYDIRFDGPASVLRETRRYGISMARFLPALVACRGWRMRAQIRYRRRWPAVLELSPRDGLHSHLPTPQQFDSQTESDFAADWGTEPRDGWTLERETEILHQQQHAFLPDFVFQHADGRRVLMEIVGFWTPEYLAAKRETLRRFADHPIVLAVMESPHHRDSSPDHLAVRFKKRLTAKAVLEILPRAAEVVVSKTNGPE